MWFFYIFLLAELANFVESGLFYFTSWKPTQQESPPPLAGRSVDVFITTYDEAVGLLRETVLCAAGMRYPHTTYLLDDGNRPEVQKLAEEFGCVYLARTAREHAKAGNLNHGLVHSRGEFIVTLDADHVAMPDLIDRLIGFFADPMMGIVQSSQDFYNLDSFQHQTEWQREYAWQQQELFFSIIQPGKDGYNAAFYCGSPAMLRRTALEQVSGFATGTITEDMHTGLRLQKKGWRVLYYNRTLARGLAPQTFVGFAMQWQRWGKGAMQVLHLEHPVFGPGLRLGQRICYFASFYFYWMSYQKLLFILTPVVCMLAGVFPLIAEPSQFLLYFTPYFVFNWIVSIQLQGGLRPFLLSEQFNLVKLPELMKSVIGLFQGKEQFSVTPKSRASAARWSEILLQLLLLAALGIALLSGVARLIGAGTRFEVWAYTVNLFWAVFYLSLIAPLLSRALTHRESRSSYRFPQRLEVPARFEFSTANGKKKLDQAYARNLNRSGFSVTRAYAIPPGTSIDVDLTIKGRIIHARGKVVRSEKLKLAGGARFANGVRFDEITPQDQDEITRYLFWEVAPRHGRLLRQTQAAQGEEEPTLPELKPVLHKREVPHGD